MLTLMLSTDWTTGRDAILDRIRQDVQHKQGGRILIVPELISHDTERRLCQWAGDTASRYAEVLSFTRLARRVADSAGSAARECLDNGGRVVAMAAAARMMHSQLKAYASVETRPEFLSGLIDAIDEFKRCCISSEDLKSASAATDGSLSQKLEELSLLMEAYESLCSRGKRDPRDQMTWCLEQMEETGYGRDRVIYVDGFPDFTRQHMAILEHLMVYAKDLVVSLNCDQPDSSMLAFEKAAATARQILNIAQKRGVGAKITYIPPRKDDLTPVRNMLFQGNISGATDTAALYTFRGESAYHEVSGAAEEIMKLIRSGCRYRDITLVCMDMAVYQPLVDLIFQRMSIPLYRSGTEEILQKNVIATILNGLEAALGGFEQRDVFRYLRSALSPLDSDICDEVENYAIVWGIRGKKWLTSWTAHPDGLSAVWDDASQNRLSAINEARKLALEPLDRLHQYFLKSNNLREQVDGLFAFLKDLDLPNELSKLADQFDASGDNRSAQVLDQLWEILLNALNQMYDVLGDTVWEAEHFTGLLRLLLSQYDVGTIPPVLDAVQIGPISAMRCHQEKHLFVLGCEEGKLPSYSGSAGVLTDQERTRLRQLGVPLTGGAMEGIQAEFAEIYGVFCGAETSVRVYCSGEQPSFVFHRLASLSGGEETIPKGILYAQTDPREAAAYLSGFSAEAEARALNLEQEYRKAISHRDHCLGRVSREGIESLYGKQLNLSASQIEKQAECRLQYFLRYGIRAKERKEATVDPAEFGTYVHAVLEDTCRTIQNKGGFHRVSLEETLSIAHEFSEIYAKTHFSEIESERMRYLFRRNTQELDMVVEELWQELHLSLFEPAAFEVNFGSGDGLPPIVIPNADMQAIVRGFIDRMDTWKTDANTYYRVVDYKTGRKDFDYCDVFNGVGLQMLLYLFALRNSGEPHLGNRPIPAGVQYFPARAPYLPADGMTDDILANEIRSKEWKRKGLLLADRDVLQAMEPGEKPRRMNYKVLKSGMLSGDVADREEMKLLERYIFKVLGKLVDQIASGDVSANPYTRGYKHNPCTYCPYRAVCGKTAEEGRRNYQTMSSDRFWEEVEREVDENGR